LGNNFDNDGLFLGGNQKIHYNSHTIPTDNEVNGKPLYYFKDTDTVTFDGIPVGEIILANCTNFDIKNLQISGSDVGIEIAFSTDMILTGNTISWNNDYGVYLYSSSDNDISVNDFISNYQSGIFLSYSSNNDILTNTGSSNGENAIHLFSASNSNLISDNDIDGLSVTSSIYNDITSNIFSFNDGNGIYLDFASSNNITDNTITNNIENGIHMDSSSDNRIMDNFIAYNQDGIYLTKSNNNNISHNDVSDNVNGIAVGFLSESNLVADNFISSNTASVVYLYSATYNEVINNSIPVNTHGINIDSSSYNNITANNINGNNWFGIYLTSSSDNIIRNNNVYTNNLFGVYLLSSSRNILKYNNIYSNDQDGLHIQSSADNLIYNNNFIDNTYQAYDTLNKNSWNFTYPIGGNYWSDYVGDDDFLGPLQNMPGTDEIGDLPFSIDTGSWDYYPLMVPSRALDNYVVMQPGWNLISVPYDQKDQEVHLVLGSIDGWYNAIQWYDITDTSDHWKHNKSTKPTESELDLINEKMGLWVYITKPGETIFLYRGTRPKENKHVELYPGWNLVGYPSLSNKLRDDALNNLAFGSDVDAIWYFNATTQEWKELGEFDYFELGRGYWIHSNVTEVWKVPL
jgi:parallel beta-helix repeat protein